MTAIVITTYCLHNNSLQSVKLLLLKIYSRHFSVIFERANLWLKDNPQWKVLSCESAESKLKHSGHDQANTSKSTYTVDKDDKTYYIRYFR